MKKINLLFILILFSCLITCTVEEPDITPKPTANPGPGNNTEKEQMDH